MRLLDQPLRHPDIDLHRFKCATAASGSALNGEERPGAWYAFEGVHSTLGRDNVRTGEEELHDLRYEDLSGSGEIETSPHGMIQSSPVEVARWARSIQQAYP